MAPQPQPLRQAHLWEDALYETAAWSCLEAALGTWCARVYRWGTEGLYADTNRVLVSACTLDRPDDPAVFVAIRVEPADNPTLSLGTRVEMEDQEAQAQPNERTLATAREIDLHAETQ